MAALDVLLSPASVVFAAAAVGCVLGKVRVKGVSLSLAAVLISAIAAGAALAAAGQLDGSITALSGQLSAVGTPMFAAALGLGSARGEGVGAAYRAAAVGALMSAVPFAAMRLLIMAAPEMKWALAGAYCGALTTTPGLSAVCESAGCDAAAAAVGYAQAYVFGVSAAVVSVQVIAEKEPPRSACADSATGSGERRLGLLETAATLCGCAVIGRITGAVRLPIGSFSLGTSGGVLCTSLAVGRLLGLKRVILPEKELGTVRSVGLMMFLLGAGLPAGGRLMSGFDVRVIPCAALMTALPIAVAAASHKLLRAKLSLSSVLAGGMTSTPAAAALAQMGRPAAAGEYSAAYISALITAVILLRTV